MTDYYHPFVSQFIKIPDYVDSKVEADYKSEKVPVRHCIKLIVTNLLMHRIIAYSRRKEFYAQKHTKYYTYTHFLHAVDLLVRDKYVLNYKRGHKQIMKYPNGISSKLVGFTKLYRDYPKPVKSPPIDLEKLPILAIDKKAIYKKEEIRKILQNDHYDSLIHFNSFSTLINLSLSTQLTHSAISITPYGTFLEEAFDKSLYLNRNYLNKIELDFSNLKLQDTHLTQVGLKRAFSGGGCGRWFQSGGYSYQQISENDRLKILINGFEAEELDYSAMHPNILYAMEGVQAPVDIYSPVINAVKQMGYSNVTKFTVKKIILMGINSKNYQNLSLAINFDKKGEPKANQDKVRNGLAPKPILYDELKAQGLKAKVILQAFQQVNPTISKYVHSALANLLMLVESEIMTVVLWELMNRHIPAVPIHDSLLFPKIHRDQVMQVMKDIYRQQTGFDIQVK